MVRTPWAAAIGIFLWLSAVVSPALAASFPPFSGPVVDQAGVLPSGAAAQIDASLNQYQQQSGNQIAVALIKTTGDDNIAAYAQGLANAWGVGQSGDNNGVVIVIATQDHNVQLEVGTGLQSQLTDANAQAIIDNDMLPDLRDGNYDAAVTAATSQVEATIGGQGFASITPAPLVPAASSSSHSWQAILFGLVVVGVGLVLLLGLFRRPSYRRSGHYWGGGWGNGPGYGGGWGAGGGAFGAGRGGFFGGGAGPGFGAGGFHAGGGGGFTGGGGGSFSGGGAGGHW